MVGNLNSTLEVVSADKRKRERIIALFGVIAITDIGIDGYHFDATIINLF